MQLRKSAAARRLAASQSPGFVGKLLNPPCFPSLPTGTQCANISTNPPQAARGVPRVRDPGVVEGPTRPICPPSDPVSCLPHPRDVVPAPVPYQDITHRTRDRLTTQLRVSWELPSPLLCRHVGAFLRFARPTPHGGLRHRLVRAALCSRCRTCSARQVRGHLCCRIGGAAAGSHAVRGDCTSSPPSPLPLPLPFKLLLLRRHHRARARGAARRYAMGGYYRDRDRGSDRDRRPVDREESSDLRRRSGGAARCSAVTRDGGGCGMVAAAGRGCHAAVRVVVALA